MGMADDSTGETGVAEDMDTGRVRAAVCSIPEWGRFVLAWNDDGLMLLGLPDRAPGEHLGRLAARGVAIESTTEVPRKFLDALTEYFNGDPDALMDLPVVEPGTDFQHDVWNALREIPLGETRSYGGIAREIGKPAATRAVGNACNANLVGIVVPCHRVIGQTGVGGYAAGVKWKQRLLEHEARIRARRANEPA